MIDLVDSRWFADSRWLVARERGEDVSHVPSATRAAYHELGALIARLPGHGPGADWRRRVLEAIGRREDRATARLRSAPQKRPRIRLRIVRPGAR
jgi:hypothetical protein